MPARPCLVDVTGVNGGGQHEEFNLFMETFRKMVEFVYKLKPVHVGHLQVQQNNAVRKAICFTDKMFERIARGIECPDRVRYATFLQ